MSQLECNKAYYNHKVAMELTKRLPKVSRVSEIFKRKPYSCTNYTVPEETDEEEQDGEV